MRIYINLIEAMIMPIFYKHKFYFADDIIPFIALKGTITKLFAIIAICYGKSTSV